MRDPATGAPAGTLIADSSKVTFAGSSPTLTWARWPVLLISGPGIPWAGWSAMTNTSGGAAPSPMACQGQPWVNVPYQATYTFWSC